MSIFDLLFLISVLFVLVCLVAIVVSVFRSEAALRRWSGLLAIYFVVYALALTSVSLSSPRRVYAPGERRCWDDWCATAIKATYASNSAATGCVSSPNARIWIAEIEVSSVAKRIRQRAPDARAELEDTHGTRYNPCSGALRKPNALPHTLSDALNPGDAFTVVLPFLLPNSASPVGIVVHHGDFPGKVIIGSDASLFHRPSLQRVVLSPEHP